MTTAPQFPAGVHRAFSPIRNGHFWFETRREFVIEAVDGLRRDRDGVALEVGCGDGFVLSRLPGSHWIGVDEALDDLRVVWRDHQIPAVAASGLALPLRVRLDMVAAFDVLEHIKDDIGALRAWQALLAPHGHLVITVPAGPELWSRRDDFAGHFRRYSRAGLRTTIEAAGFRVERLRPLFRTLWPLAWLNARVTRGTAVADPVAEYRVSKPFNMLLRLLVRTEEALLHGSDRGRGTSWLVVARPKCRVADGSAA